MATGGLDPFDGPWQESRNATPSSWAPWYKGTDDDPHQIEPEEIDTEPFTARYGAKGIPVETIARKPAD